jgi:hypothetical protein
MDALKFYLHFDIRFSHHIRFRYFYPHSFLDYHLVINLLRHWRENSLFKILTCTHNLALALSLLPPASTWVANGVRE